MKYLLPLIACLLASAAATAQDATPWTRCREAEFRSNWPIVLVCSQRPGQLVQGSGVPIAGDENRLILTAHHVAAREYPILVVSQDGNIRAPAQVVASDAAHDVSLLRVQFRGRRQGRSPMGNMPFAPQGPCGPGSCSSGSCGPQQMPGTWGGFNPQTEQYRELESMVVPYGSAWLRSAGQLDDGMSGGPIYNEHGLLGIIVAKARTAEGVRPQGCGISAAWIQAWLSTLSLNDADLSTRLAANTSPKPPLAVQGDYLGQSWQPVAWKSRLPHWLTSN